MVDTTTRETTTSDSAAPAPLPAECFANQLEEKHKHIYYHQSEISEETVNEK